MPIYEYACEACGHEFEYLVRNGAGPTCPECSQATELTRRFSVPAAHARSGGSLPMADLREGTCGRPQCGQGGCQGG